MALLTPVMLLGCQTDLANEDMDGDSDTDTGEDTDMDVGGDGDGDGDGDPGPDWAAELDHVFPRDYVVDIELDFAEGDWASMINDFLDAFIKDYRPAAFTFAGVETLPEVGARFKGFSSLLYILDEEMSFDPTLKYPLKLNFNHYGGARFHSLDKLSLGNNQFDRSYMRERLAARVYEAMGVPVARTAYATVQVDDTYLGIYTLAQPIDKQFLSAHYGSDEGMDEGNLYKCSRTHDDHCRLAWRGDQKEDYITTECPQGYPECGLLQKTNEDDPALNDYSDLIGFLDVVNNTSDEEFQAQLEQVFEVDSFLRLAAVTIALSSFDSYFAMGNNYYLYHRPDTGRFEMIPWDLNMSYGHFPCSNPDGSDEPDPAVPDDDMTRAAVDGTFCWSAKNDYPLAERIFAVPAYLATYQGYLREIAETILTQEQQSAWISEFDDLIRPLIEDDPNYPGTLEDYDETLGATPAAWWVEYNLMDFIQRRQAFILGEL